MLRVAMAGWHPLRTLGTHCGHVGDVGGGGLEREWHLVAREAATRSRKPDPSPAWELNEWSAYDVFSVFPTGKTRDQGATPSG